MPKGEKISIRLRGFAWEGACICVYHSFGFAPCRIWYLNYLVWWCVCVEQFTFLPYYEIMCFIFVMCKCGWLTLQQIMSLPCNDHLLICWSSYCQMPIWSNGILSHNMVWYDIQTLSSSPCHTNTQWMILCKYNFCSCLGWHLSSYVLKITINFISMHTSRGSVFSFVLCFANRLFCHIANPKCCHLTPKRGRLKEQIIYPEVLCVS